RLPDGLRSIEDRGQIDETAGESGVGGQNGLDIRCAHGGADVSGQFSVFEQSPVEQLSSLDGGPACCRESRYAQSHDESVSSAGGLDVPAAGGQSRLGGGPDIAPQGGVDSAGDEIDLPGGVDDRRGELGGHMV